jgi:predicted MPP superfamily phosphohydrolase
MRVREVELTLPRWPARLDGLRVALVADLHAGGPLTDVDGVVAAVQAAGADLIALLGDYVDPSVVGARPLDPRDVADALARLRAPAGVHAVLGNHDWVHTGRGMRDALLAAGIPVLENEAVRLDVRGGPLWLAGTADESERDARVGETLAGVPNDEPLIVLAHNPDTFPYVPARAAITLSGHTHGGQIDLPLLRSRVIPSRHGARYKAGHIVEQGRHLFVSRGIGTSRWPIRLRSRAEVPVLGLRACRS